MSSDNDNVIPIAMFYSPIFSVAIVTAVPMSPAMSISPCNEIKDFKAFRKYIDAAG